MNLLLLLLLFLVLAPVSGLDDEFCDSEHHVCLRRQRIDTRSFTGVSPEGAPRSLKHVIVKLQKHAGLESLERLGCSVAEYLPHNSWVVFVPEEVAIESVRELEGVVWIGDYKPEYKIAPEWDGLGENHENFRRDEAGRVLATVLLSGIRSISFETVDALIESWRSSLKEGVLLEKLGEDTLQAAIPLSRAEEVVLWLAEQQWVTWIAPAFKAFVDNMFASSIEQSGVSAPLKPGASYLPSRPLWGMGIMGQNQIVGVGDSGVDLRSCYFRDDEQEPGPAHRKILSYRVMWGGDMLDAYGHGSHVAGSVVGECGSGLNDFSVDASKYNGMAPQAKLVFTDIGLGKNTYVTPPTDLSDYYWHAYNLGARIHTDSWTTLDSSYNIMSRSVDLFAYNNLLFLPIFSAGNAGSSHTSVGTLTSPALAKNCLTVGATNGGGGKHHAHHLHRHHHHQGMLKMVFQLGSNEATSLRLQIGVLEHSYGATFDDGSRRQLSRTSSDACDEHLQGVAGAIVLASRQGCSIVDKFVNAQQAGAVAVIVYNNENTGYFTFPDAPRGSVWIPGGSLPKRFGEYLDSMLASGEQLFVRVSGHFPQAVEHFDSMAAFSSWGPTPDGRVKPEVVAPGEKIISAKSSLDSSAPTCKTCALSGTSMAAPITAGGVALVRQYFTDGFYPTGSKVSSGSLSMLIVSHPQVLSNGFEPSGALLKAVIINGATPLRGLNAM